MRGGQTQIIKTGGARLSFLPHSMRSERVDPAIAYAAREVPGIKPVATVHAEQRRLGGALI
jgi:hypothetical protein